MDEAISQEGFSSLEDRGAELANEQMTLFDMQELAVRKTGTIEEIKAQLKTAREMLSDTFENNDMFREQKEQANSSAQPFKQTKAMLEKTPEVIAQKNKIAELKAELQMKQKEVSEYAIEVYRQTGQREFDIHGATYEINTVAKLTRRKQ